MIPMMKNCPDMYGISGSTGSYVYYIPEYDAVFAGTFNQRNFMKKHIFFLLKAEGILCKYVRRK